MSETARRLAAIMAVDVAGYSRLMGEDEAGTARSVREHREAARPIVAGHGGRIVKTMGDGVLLEFPSVVAAVECAIAVQRLMVERNEDVPEAKRIVYRIGINLGDVLIEGEDIVGDGVNIAARLENIAEPGGICLSGTAYEHVRGKIDATFTDLGELALKNIARPVRVYAISSSPPPRGGKDWDEVGDSKARTTTSPSRAIGAGPALFPLKGGEGNLGPPRLSIVVLPFANIGGDPEQEYFVDGVTESLTTDLSRISGSFVIARNTAFTYKGKPFDVKQIGHELNVRYVLEGSVQCGGNRMRVNVQLIDAVTGNHLWAERFDKPVADLFDMQDEIVARLANQLNAELVEAEARRAERAPHPDSMDLYFQGLAWVHRGASPGNFAKAKEFFHQALMLEAGNVDASVWSSWIDVTMAAGYMVDDLAPRIATAETLLNDVLSLAPDHPFAHAVLGTAYAATSRGDRAIAECEHALALDRNQAHAHVLIGATKLTLGLADETAAHVAEAFRLSPRDVLAYTWLWVAGSAKLYLGQDEEAMSWLRRSIDANRNFPAAHLYLASALAHRGRLDEARAAVQTGLALDPGFTIRRFLVSAMSNNATYLTQREHVIDGMRKAGVPEG